MIPTADVVQDTISAPDLAALSGKSRIAISEFGASFGK